MIKIFLGFIVFFLTCNSCYSQEKLDSLYIDWEFFNYDTIEVMDFLINYSSNDSYCYFLENNFIFISEGNLRSVNSYYLFLDSKSRSYQFYSLYYVYFILFLKEDSKFRVLSISKSKGKGTKHIIEDQGHKDEKEMNKIVKKYNNWLDELKENGLNNSRKLHLSPFKNSHYKWFYW